MNMRTEKLKYVGFNSISDARLPLPGDSNDKPFITEKLMNSTRICDLYKIYRHQPKYIDDARLSGKSINCTKGCREEWVLQ